MIVMGGMELANTLHIGQEEEQHAFDIVASSLRMLMHRALESPQARDALWVLYVCYL